MYNHFQLLGKYIRYRWSASSGKGHGIHSPFVFDFIKKVLLDKKKYDSYHVIEQVRKKMQADKSLIEVEDFGAGSSVIKSNKRVIKDIARSSLKPKKYSQLLHRMVRHYQPKTMVELGTSFGITSAYLATGKPDAKLYTLEGASSIENQARLNFEAMSLHQIELIQGDFSVTLPRLLEQCGNIDFAFIDGNHRLQPTLDYFEQLLKKSTPSTLLVFDDIHWSKEMEAAWKIIQNRPDVSLTIDLFFIGIVSVNPDVKNKQHFTISF